mgnify:CR=1 FL=1
MSDAFLVGLAVGAVGATALILGIEWLANRARPSGPEVLVGDDLKHGHVVRQIGGLYEVHLDGPLGGSYWYQWSSLRFLEEIAAEAARSTVHD